MKLVKHSPSGLYPALDFIVYVKRQGNSLTISLLLPCFLIVLSGTFYVLLPRGESERSGFLSTILLTLIMFIVLLSNLVPVSKKTPKLIYLLLFLCFISVMTLLGALIINWKHKIVTGQIIVEKN